MNTKVQISLMAITQFRNEVIAVRNNTSDFSKGADNLDRIAKWIGELIELLYKFIRILLEKLGILSDKKEEIKQELLSKEEEKKELESELRDLNIELNSTPQSITIYDDEGNENKVPNPEYIRIQCEIAAINGELHSVESEIKCLRERLQNAEALTKQITSHKSDMEYSINVLTEIKDETRNSIIQLNDIRDESDKCSDIAQEKLDKIINLVEQYMNINVKEGEVNGHSSVGYGNMFPANRNIQSEFDKLIESKTHTLTEDNKRFIHEELKWSERKMKKCTIDEDGNIFYRTDRYDLDGKLNENGIPYVRKKIQLNGVNVFGVFPVFSSSFDMQLEKEDYTSRAYASICNRKLLEEINRNEIVASRFTKEQIAEIKNGDTPTGFVWHHNEEPGKMQLVLITEHDRVSGGAAHTGGNALWGPDSIDRNDEGEFF